MHMLVRPIDRLAFIVRSRFRPEGLGRKREHLVREDEIWLVTQSRLVTVKLRDVSLGETRSTLYHPAANEVAAPAV